MLVSPPEKLLEAGIKVKKAELSSLGVKPMIILGFLALGVVVYLWHRNTMPLAHYIQQETDILPPPPMSAQDVVKKWQAAFSTGQLGR